MKLSRLIEMLRWKMADYGDIEVAFDCDVEIKVGYPKLGEDKSKTFNIQRDISEIHNISLQEDCEGQKTLLLKI